MHAGSSIVSSIARRSTQMPDGLTRAQRRVIAAVMALLESDGFVMAGGAALVASGVSDRPTKDLDAFSSTCAEVDVAAERLRTDLVEQGYIVEVVRSSDSFAQLVVASGRLRRSEIAVDLGRDAQLFESVSTPLGPALSVRELAANKILAAFGRHEPRDLVDLAAIARVGSVDEAFAGAARKDPGFDLTVFREMVGRTIGVRDDLWPSGSDPALVRAFVADELLAR